MLYLEAQGYSVVLEGDGEKGLQQAVSLPGYDLLILDAKLPERNGFDVLREVRTRGVRTPVLMLTGLGAHEDKMRGFELGADDYLTKPFSTEELLARVQAILRRSQSAQDDGGVYDVGGLTVDLDGGVAKRGNERVELT